jgi:hypothetical protein
VERSKLSIFQESRGEKENERGSLGRRESVQWGDRERGDREGYDCIQCGGSEHQFWFSSWDREHTPNHRIKNDNRARLSGDVMRPQEKFCHVNKESSVPV